MSGIESTLQTIDDNLQQLPFYDTILEKWNEYAGDRFKTKDPYTYIDPATNKKHKLKLPDNATKVEKKIWKQLQRKAWINDKCFMGCYPIDCGIGLSPILLLLPVIGPIMMWGIQTRLITIASQNYNIDSKTYMKLQSNIMIELIISIPPLIGSFLSWLNGCSTRNIAIIHTKVVKLMLERAERDKLGVRPALPQRQFV
ncbi:hypothetical protein CANARDRAFT_196941 [[Candida] arabinofermentans NRRL YB-2248]|uniref:Uncharacterized protein n=1 Tax=[Candida] arabinofermentans NRRL YB-2248 TaxID=983967 RepID=A0A1E4T315_9ASCO|nr:hypothetical protein CANARDRAFT_196941 [[Candida] arabinofermentans NRRL YB-2248]